MSQFILIPFYRIRIGKIEHNILVRKSSFCIFYVKSFFNQFFKKRILRSKIWQLPQTNMKSFIPQIFQHLLGIRKTFGRKLIIALPILIKPTGIKMNDIGRNFIFSQILCYFIPFFLRKIGNSAHPCSKRP